MYRVYSHVKWQFLHQLRQQDFAGLDALGCTWTQLDHAVHQQVTEMRILLGVVANEEYLADRWNPNK